MRLTDIMSSMGLAAYAELGMVLFLIAFLIVGAQLMFARRSEVDAAAALPLNDGQPAGPIDAGRHS